MVEQKDNQLETPAKEPNISEQSFENEDGVRIENLKPQEIQELREQVMEEINQPEASPEVPKKDISKDRPIILPPTAQPAVKSPLCRQIEEVMADGLDEVYLSMTADEQQAFKAEGEKTASKIEIILKSTKIKIKMIIGLLRKWLILIPGVNKFFLEQEAKIKCDKILKIKS